MKRNMLLRVSVVVVLLTILALSSTGLGATKIIMKVAHADAMDVYSSRKHGQLVTFANLVNARSGGRIEVQVFGSGQLGAEREYVEGIQAGTVQGGIASGVVGSFFPESMMTDIPYLFPSASVAWAVLDGPFGQKLSDMFLARTGMRNLGFAEVGFRHFTNSKRAIKSPADMKGLKIRVQETQVFLTLVRELGASPTPIAWTETYTALQTKVVDGQENPVSTIVFAKFAEVQKYLTLDGHVYGVDWFVINEKFFKSLDRDLQEIIVDSAKISANVSRGLQQLNSAVGLETLAKAGMEIYSPTEAELAQFKALTQKPVIDWLKTKMDPKLIDELLKTIDDTVKAQKAAF
jgi:tripartite ATP-independent transporter DctP family solute receptor